MRGGKGYPQAGGAAGDGRVTDRRDENALLAQDGGGFERLSFGADENRDDGGGEI